MGGADLVPREQPYQTAIHCQRSRLRHRFSVAPPLVPRPHPLAGKGLVLVVLNQQSCDNHVRQLIRRNDGGVAVGFCFCTALGCVSCRELRRDLVKYCFGSVPYSVPLQADS